MTLEEALQQLDHECSNPFDLDPVVYHEAFFRMRAATLMVRLDGIKQITQEQLIHNERVIDEATENIQDLLVSIKDEAERIGINKRESQALTYSQLPQGET